MSNYTFLEIMGHMRDSFFDYVSQKRHMRILLISWFIAMVWIFADWKSGSLSVNLWDDVICLLFGIAVERILPWGKE